MVQRRQKKNVQKKREKRAKRAKLFLFVALIAVGSPSWLRKLLTHVIFK